ncbi:DUF1163 domain-containing protein [Chryseobacterium sp. RR2-3-20]|uniref:DUF1163 domain-containing protein n=1 Tax=Chryseobacterium sp. RR2-3-20 TaxID=2787626 RepID=UPI001ADF292C|nr:DUF1163 domain-containing protein [Chryseobacterium sp. RR2-3-20]
MRNFTDNKPLLQNIQNNDIKEIKRILIDNIFFLQGNREEINKAIRYALDKSDFRFDENKDLEVSNINDKERCFSEEQFNLGENYSEERYNVLVDLYNEVYANKEYIYENEPATDKNKVAKIVAVAVGVGITVYILYRILD